MGVGTGIAFFLELLLVAIVSIFWIVAWLRKGFRLRRRGDQSRIRRVALWTLVAVFVLMLCFPPLRRIGTWSELETNAPIPTELGTLYDRDEFGYIPTYAWIGRCSETETPEISTTVKLDPHAAYHLDAIGWTVDWWFLFGQLSLTLIYALPFITACNDKQRTAGC